MTPKFFWVAAVLSLLWNMIGDAAYLAQVSMNAATLASLPEYDAKIFSEMPMWVWSAYALAVWCGTLGAIGLLLRRRFAVPLFFLSALAVVAQFSYSFGMTDILAVKGPSAMAFPATIFILALAQWWFARAMTIRRVLR